MSSLARARREDAAQLVVVGFSGTQLSQPLASLIDQGVGGVVLFSRNIESPEQVADLIRSIKIHARRPIYVAIDQEGGVVQRLRSGFCRVPPMRRVGESRDRELAKRVGRLLGKELDAVGIDVNFAPVIDVDTNPLNPVIGDRSFSSDPSVVAELGVALGQGLEELGVASCGKHFPGHGDTELDSHLELPTVRHDLSRLQSVEFLPFRSWAQAGLSSVMTAHVVFEALDPGRPATMSEVLLSRILRQDMNYEGLVISDDLEMKSIIDHFGAAHAAVEGLRAGVDQFLVCHQAHVATLVIDALFDAVVSGEIKSARFEQALGRAERFSARWAKPPRAPRFDQLATRESQSVIDEVEARSLSHGDPSRHDPTERDGD